MRSAEVFLLLLLCQSWTWAQGGGGGVTENDVPQTQGEERKEDIQFEVQGVKAGRDENTVTPDVSVEVKELRDMTIELKMELQNSLSRIEMLEQENAGEAQAEAH